MINFEIKNNVSLAICGRENQSGRSMIEMLGVLAIIGVLSVGGIAGYSKAMMKYRINKTIEQITLIAGNVRAFWGPQRNYEGVDCRSSGDGTCSTGCRGLSKDNTGSIVYADNGCPIVKKAKIFPDEMITVSGDKIMSITTPFGGWVALSPVDKAKSGDNQAFDIEYNINDIDACIELATHDWSTAGAGLIGIWDTEDTSDVDFFTLPAEVDKVAEVCSHVTDNSRLLIYFDVDVNFYKTMFTIAGDTLY